MEVKSFNLRPNWNLLDSTFESYKLSLQQLPVYHVDPECKVDTVSLAIDEFSYNRTRTVSLHNYLFGDPWNERDCYFVDNAGHIRRLSVIVETSISSPQSVFQLGSHFLQTERHLPVTLSFPSPSLCLISDGAGLMYVLDTGDRQVSPNKDTKWNGILSGDIVGDSSSPALLLHSSQNCEKLDSENQKMKDVINILTLRFEEEKQDDVISTPAVIEWTWLFRYDTDAKYEVGGHRTFKGKQAPFYAAFGESGTDIFIGSHSTMKYTPDWDQQILNEEMDTDDAEPASNEMEAAPEDLKPLYKWTQTEEDITVLIPMPEGADKTSVIYSLSKNKITAGFKDATGKVDNVIDGKLFVEVDFESSNWSVAERTLTITIQKELEGQSWPFVIAGDTRGEMISSGTDQDDIDMMDKDEMQDLEARGFQPSGLEHYEECDDLPDVDSMLYRFDATANRFIHEASVASNQWLFNCYHDKKLCTVLRHDVDALVWESNTPNDLNASPWTHIATFNALGYVRASKEDVKYLGCSPNASYSALCESSGRLFVYHSPTTTAVPLRNRITGKNLHVSKQQVVTLPSNDPIIGFHATTELMFVLTEAKIFAIKVNAPDN